MEVPRGRRTQPGWVALKAPARLGIVRHASRRGSAEALRTRRLRIATLLFAAVGVSLAFSAVAAAAPGDLDPTFSGDGKQTTDFPFGLSNAAAVVPQPDGKIIAVGSDRVHGNFDFALARYNPDGSLDTTFSGNGKQTTDFGGFDDHATGVALQADGKIVVVGSSDTNGGPQDFALARYNPDGSLDTSFSGDGKQTTDFGAFEGATGVALQGDGKIVVVGETDDVHFGAFALARYNPDGSLDTSFSGDGKQTTDFGGVSERDDVANAVALQSNGKIVAAGFAGECDFALARYNANGTPDTTFSGDGKQRTPVGGCGSANGVALQANGKIVAAGQSFNGADNDFALARYNPNGSLDTSFSGDGKQTTNFGGGTDAANGVAIQGDGKIVAAGGGGVGDDFALARYNPNGSLDTTFSGDGRQTTSFLGGAAAAGGVALQGGKIVAAGHATGTVSNRFALARYNPNGSLDTSFSGDGRQTTDFLGGVDEGANGVTLQGDGKIIAVGGVGGGDFALARYSADGSLDTSFSGNGKQTTNFGTGVDEANGVALQANGRIVVVGGTGSSSVVDDFALARYNPNGSLDTTFSGDGRQTTDFGGGTDSATGVAIQGDGKIVVVGGGGGPSNEDFSLARYNPNGSLDTTFSGDGRQTTDFGGADAATGVAIQGDGKIVVVGRGGGGHFALARYNTNGSLDTTFSGDGKQTTDLGGSSASASAVALQGDGKIVVVGSSFSTGPGNDFALARYNPNGSLDTSFSGDGTQTTDFGGLSDGATGVALQGDGKIVAAGSAGTSPARDFALARYNASGSLDTTFSGDGMQTTDFGNDDRAAGVALQGDGNIVVAGVGLGPKQTDDFALARYLGG